MAEATLTVAEVARKLKVSDDTVLAHIRSGRLRAVNVGLGAHRPRWRVAPEALAQFLTSQTTPERNTPRRRKAPGRVIEFF